MIINKQLNVTQIEPRLKHPTIFEHFDALTSGESFIILNDHDPKPLYYQLLGERGPIFTWEYLENGPENWQVRIAKPEAEKPELTIGEIAAKDLRKAEVFKKMGIDFCCGGKQTLTEAAESVGLSKSEIEEVLAKTASEIEKHPEVSLNFNSWDLGFLADYITQVHHRYIRENGPITAELAEKVAERHGHQYPELINLSKGFQKLISDLTTHLDEEESELFPLIKSLNDENFRVQDLEKTIDILMDDHEDTGNLLRQFRVLTKDFELPADACNSYISLYSRIQELENDLFQHIHLENNILFPKTLDILHRN